MFDLASFLRSPRVRAGCAAAVFAVCALAGRAWWQSTSEAHATTELELPDSLKSLDGAERKPQGSASMPAAADLADAGATGNPDLMLVEVYRAISANDVEDALAKADRLIARYPKFRLGHLVRGDLLMMHANPVTVMGAAPNGAADRLQDLRAEAIQRINALRQKPDPNLVPRAVLQMSEAQKYALVVDAKKSRLYVYQNRDGKPTFLTDYYITQGKLGVDKVKAGDQRTPLGVYYITGRIDRKKLPEFYGSGALPLNYPNEWDKVNNRSGYGIWLHGTPPDTYSRPPLASDGCVVLTNDDFEKLAASAEPGSTPVVIAQQVEFVDRAKWQAERAQANAMVEAWRRDLERMEPAALLTHYSNVRFKSTQGQDLTAWYAKNRLVVPASIGLQVKLNDMTFFRYPGREDMIVASFTQDNLAGKTHSSLRKRQYWMQENGQWKIVHEAIVNNAV
jgi:murein L,D-transpeptidase YafK